MADTVGTPARSIPRRPLAASAALAALLIVASSALALWLATCLADLV